MKFKDMLDRQKIFSDLFFDSASFNDLKKEEMTKSFALAAHGEITDLVSSINFKEHRANRKTPDREKILYESVDAFRYLLAIMNIWGYTSEEIESAFTDKDTYLHMRYKSENAQWDGSPVLIVDVDDVISHFRKDYFKWLDETCDLKIPEDYPEYYASTPLNARGINPEASYKDFTSQRKLRDMQVIEGIGEVLRKAQDMGFWIQLLTARPDQNLICLYDTYHWLASNNIPFDGLAFSGEKYRWIVQSPFYGHVAACIDDSPKHAAEYASHGLLVLSPALAYNTNLTGMTNVIQYTGTHQLLSHLTQIYEEKKK